jgi:hypothetical protein
MQDYGLETPVLQAVVRTFLDVFPGATLWFSSLSCPDVFLVGSVKPLCIDVAALEQRLAAVQVENPSDPPRRLTAEGLLRCFIAGPDALRRFAADAPLTRDARPMLEYAAEASLLTGSAAPTLETIATLCESAVPWLVNASPGLVERLERRAAANRALNRIMVDFDARGPKHKEEAFDQMRLLVAAHHDDRELRHAIAATFATAANEGFLREGDYPALRRLLTDALALTPDQPAVLVVAARLDAALGHVDEALHKLDLAAQSSAPWRVSPRYNRARILLNAQRPRETIELCRQMVADDPELGVAWELFARACEMAGDAAGAHAAWSRLLELDPESDAAKRALGLAASRGGP